MLILCGMFNEHLLRFVLAFNNLTKFTRMKRKNLHEHKYETKQNINDQRHTIDKNSKSCDVRFDRMLFNSLEK